MIHAFPDGLNDDQAKAAWNRSSLILYTQHDTGTAYHEKARSNKLLCGAVIRVSMMIFVMKTGPFDVSAVCDVIWNE